MGQSRTPVMTGYFAVCTCPEFWWGVTRPPCAVHNPMTFTLISTYTASGTATQPARTVFYVGTPVRRSRLRRLARRLFVALRRVTEPPRAANHRPKHGRSQLRRCT